MFKKAMLAAAILAATSGIAVAGPKPYVGVGVGISTNTSTNASGMQQFARVVPFNMFAGYGGLVTDTFYLAGELNGTVGSAKITSQGSNIMGTSYGFGLSLIPGVMLSQHTMAYARGGLVETRFNNVKKMSTGGIFGLGMQTSLTEHFDVRGEYDFTAYKSVSTISSPKSDAFNLGLVYKF